MAHWRKSYPSKYLRACDLDGPTEEVIREVTETDVGDDVKLMLAFESDLLPMVVNVTNARCLAGLYGDDTDNWIGNSIEVYTAEVFFKGEPVEGLRLRAPNSSKKKGKADNLVESDISIPSTEQLLRHATKLENLQSSVIEQIKMLSGGKRDKAIALLKDMELCDDISEHGTVTKWVHSYTNFKALDKVWRTLNAALNNQTADELEL